MGDIEIEARKVVGTFTHQGTAYYRLAETVTREAVSLATLLTDTAPAFACYGQGHREAPIPDEGESEEDLLAGLPPIPPRPWPAHSEPVAWWLRLRWRLGKLLALGDGSPIARAILQRCMSNTPCVLTLRDNALVYTVSSQEAATWLAVAVRLIDGSVIRKCAAPGCPKILIINWKREGGYQRHRLTCSDACRAKLYRGNHPKAPGKRGRPCKDRSGQHT